MNKKKSSRRNKILVSLFFCTSLFAKTPTSSYRVSYIEQFKGVAMQEMRRSGIPASITLAQGILESGWGKSPLAQATNNHFGIKCHGDWAGERHVTNSESAGEAVKHTCYRAYPTANDSYVDHTDFLLHQSLYKALFTHKDYRNWAEGLEVCGYAGSKSYSELLIGVIERNELVQFDILVEAEQSQKALAAYEPNKWLKELFVALEKNEAIIQNTMLVEVQVLSNKSLIWLDDTLEIIAPAYDPRRRNKKIAKEGEILDDIWV